LQRFIQIKTALSYILKEVPVLQCESCTEYLLEDNVLQRVEKILVTVDPAAELEIIKFAA